MSGSTLCRELRYLVAPASRWRFLRLHRGAKPPRPVAAPPNHAPSELRSTQFRQAPSRARTQALSVLYVAITLGL